MYIMDNIDIITCTVRCISLCIAITIVITIAVTLLVKKQPILRSILNQRYATFKNAYTSYKDVTNGNKRYKAFAEDFLAPQKRIINRNDKKDQKVYYTAHKVCNVIENHQEMVERYFSNNFGYYEYLNMMSEYDLFQEQVIAITDSNVTDNNHKRTVTIARKVMLLKAIFDACGVNVPMTEEARFISDILEIEQNTENIANTNIYKQLKKLRIEATKDKEIEARINNLKYVIEQLEHLGLEKVQRKLTNELEDYKRSINL